MISGKDLFKRLLYKVPYYQPGGLSIKANPYVKAKRKGAFLLAPEKALLSLRRSLGFVCSVGSYLGPIWFVGGRKHRGAFASLITNSFLRLCTSVTPANSSRISSTLTSYRYWNKPFRPSYLSRWTPGVLSNYKHAVKKYKNASYKISKDFVEASPQRDVWLLPYWFPSCLVSLSVFSDLSAARESRHFAVPLVGMGFAERGGVSLDGDVTFPIVAKPTPLLMFYACRLFLSGYQSGLLGRLRFVSRVKAARKVADLKRLEKGHKARIKTARG